MRRKANTWDIGGLRFGWLRLCIFGFGRWLKSMGMMGRAFRELVVLWKMGETVEEKGDGMPI